jgi:DEAD/DEAH box helicase domain-containing protein
LITDNPLTIDLQVYDGDTPHAERVGVRARAQLLITNPDMLHQSILPCHTSFASLLARLELVVVDEVLPPSLTSCLPDRLI